MVSYSILYKGKLRCDVTHNDNKAALLTDAPKDNFGEGTSYSASDLVAVALGTCIITTIGIKLRLVKVNIDGTTVQVEKHMSADLPRRIAKIVVKLSFPSGISHDYKEKIKEIGNGCPVAKSLHPDVVQEIKYHFPD